MILDKILFNFVRYTTAPKLPIQSADLLSIYFIHIILLYNNIILFINICHRLNILNNILKKNFKYLKIKHILNEK